MKPANIVFMGTPDIAVSMLQRMLNDGYHIVCVVTQPDKKVGRKQELHMPEVKQKALKEHIKVLQPVRIKDAMDELMHMDIDLIVTCAYGQFIPAALLAYPIHGSINVHASLLPKLRGGAPIHKAIMYGEKKTGISIMRMVKKMDAGAVMSQCEVNIEEDDTMGDLYDKLSIAGADLLSKSMPKVLNDTAVFINQNESEATFAYTISKEEEWIDFQQPLNIVYNHMRGLLPFPVSYGCIQQKKIKFHKVRKLAQSVSVPAGEVVGIIDGGFAIACLDGYILADELQMEGKAKTNAKNFYNGVGRNLVGMRFLK